MVKSSWWRAPSADQKFFFGIGRRGKQLAGGVAVEGRGREYVLSSALCLAACLDVVELGEAEDIEDIDPALLDQAGARAGVRVLRG